jgi:hypothetical protein
MDLVKIELGNEEDGWVAPNDADDVALQPPPRRDHGVGAGLILG